MTKKTHPHIAARVLSRQRNADVRELQIASHLWRELPTIPKGGMAFFRTSSAMTFGAALLGLAKQAGGRARLALVSFTVTAGSWAPLEAAAIGGLLSEPPRYLVHPSTKTRKGADLSGIDQARVRFERTHAKGAAVIGAERAFAVCCSANLTRGTETELYAVAEDLKTALALEAWIRGEE